MANKYFQQPRMAELKGGDRMVVDAWFKYSGDGAHQRAPRAVVTVRSPMPLSEVPLWPRHETPAPDGPYAVGEDGTRFEICPRQGSLAIRERLADGTFRDRYPQWTLPVPDIPDDEVLAYVDAFRGATEMFRGRVGRSDSHDHNCVFVVSGFEGDHAVARMASWASDTQAPYLEYLEERKSSPAAFPNDDAFHFIEDLEGFMKSFTVDGDLAISSFDVRIPKSQLPDAVEPGSIVVGSSFWVNIRGGVDVTSVATASVAGNVRTHPLSTYLPYRPSERREGKIFWRPHDGIELSTIQDWLKERARAVAKLDPDEILLAVLPKDESDPPYRDAQIVAYGSRGAVFFEMEAEWLETISMEDHDPGLWVYRNASPWAHHDPHSGEHDSGIDGDWHPATLEDVASFGNDPVEMEKSLADEYEGADYADVVSEGTFLEELMRLAKDACRRDAPTPA